MHHFIDIFGIPIRELINPMISGHSSQIPCTLEQGIFGKEQGILKAEQGISDAPGKRRFLTHLFRCCRTRSVLALDFQFEEENGWRTSTQPDSVMAKTSGGHTMRRGSVAT